MIEPRVTKTVEEIEHNYQEGTVTILTRTVHGEFPGGQISNGFYLDSFLITLSPNWSHVKIFGRKVRKDGTPGVDLRNLWKDKDLNGLVLKYAQEFVADHFEEES